MAYLFKGVFTQEVSLDLSELERLFSGYARKITTPFRGVGVSFEEELWDLDRDELRQKVQELSRKLGDSLIVYLYYSTWGGPVEYCYGFACRDGALLEEAEGEDKAGVEVFDQLIGYVSFAASAYNFPPFERGFFPNT